MESDEEFIPEWRDIFEHPSVLLILGRRGSGKTALGHRLLEAYGKSDDGPDAYIMGYPATEADRLPDWIDTLPSGIPMDEWPENSVVLLHEAHMIMHARRSMDVENLEIDRLVTVSRHRQTTIITETQQSQRLDRNAVTAVDGLIVREPALLQADFERKQVRKIIRQAEDVFDKYTTTVETDDYTWREKSEDAKKAAYIHSERFVGEYPHDIRLADHWSEDISTVYSQVDDEGEDTGLQLSEKEMNALHDIADWEEENRPLEYSHKGIEHEQIGHARAWNTLASLQRKGLIEKTYDSNNKTYWRLNDDGWDIIDREPDDPLFADGVEEEEEVD